MSKIYNNGIVTTAGFQFNANLPLDDRLAVETFQDLALLTCYDGMIVYVKNEQKHYSYINSSWSVFSGEVIELSDYATKTEVEDATQAVKNDLLNGAGEAYDTLKELGDLISENVDAIDALEQVATNKAEKDHTHEQYLTEHQPLNEYAKTAELANVATSGQFEDIIIGEDIIFVLDGGGADAQLAVLDKTVLK